MANRISIYAGKSLDRVLQERTDATGAMAAGTNSAVVNKVADRYQEVIRQSMPQLSLGSWCLLFDSLNGVWMQEGAAMYVGALTQGVQDSIRLEALDRKWEVDGEDLLSLLHDLPFCSRLAIIDAAERWWARGTYEGETLRDSVVAVVGEANVTSEEEAE